MWSHTRETVAVLLGFLGVCAGAAWSAGCRTTARIPRRRRGVLMATGQAAPVGADDRGVDRVGPVQATFGIGLGEQDG